MRLASPRLHKEEVLYYYPALRAPLLKEGELELLVPIAYCLLPVAYCLLPNSFINQLMHLQPYPALGQLVGFGIGTDAVGEEHEDELLFRVAPDHRAGEALVPESAGGGAGGHDGRLAGGLRRVEAETAHLTVVQGVHLRELRHGTL